jgi:hypothetical protein
MGRHVLPTPLDGRTALFTRTGPDAWGRARRGRHVARPPVSTRLTDGAIPTPRPMPAGRPGALARRPPIGEAVAAVREPDPDVTAAHVGPEPTMAQRTLPVATDTLPATTGTLPAATEPNAPDVPEDAASIPQLPVRQRSHSTQSLPPGRPLDRPGPDIMRRVLSALHRL